MKPTKEDLLKQYAAVRAEIKSIVDQIKIHQVAYSDAHISPQMAKHLNNLLGREKEIRDEAYFWGIALDEG